MRESSNSGIMAGAWGLAAGLVGSLCCIGPTAAVLLGLGSSSMLLGLSFDSTLALAGGGALLLSGLIFLPRRSRACALRPAIRWRDPALMLACFALAYSLLGMLAPALAARRVDPAAASAATELQRQNLSLPTVKEGVAEAAPLRRLTLIVEKMNCPPCAATVRTALRRQPTVRAFVAESGNDQVTIDYDSSRTSAKKLTALFPARYGITPISDGAIP